MGGRATRRFPFIVLALAGWGASAARAGGVVGSGTAGSCTEAALGSALAGGGTVTFSCGGGAVVIPITSTKLLATSTTIDGTGQQVTLDGGGSTKLFQTTTQYAAQLDLVFRKLTLRNGRAADQGAGIDVRWRTNRVTTVLVEDVTFQNNVVPTSQGDWGGGAISGVRAVFTIRRSTFVGNRGSNGGAIFTKESQATIEDSLFQNNATQAAVGDPFNGGVGGTEGRSTMTARASARGRCGARSSRAIRRRTMAA